MSMLCRESEHAGEKQQPQTWARSNHRRGPAHTAVAPAAVRRARSRRAHMHGGHQQVGIRVWASGDIFGSVGVRVWGGADLVLSRHLLAEPAGVHLGSRQLHRIDLLPRRSQRARRAGRRRAEGAGRLHGVCGDRVRSRPADRSVGAGDFAELLLAARNSADRSGRD
eukprot:345029-Rhodomonas_salina.3